MNPRTRRQRRLACKWGKVGRHYSAPQYGGANTGGRSRLLVPMQYHGDPWAPRWRWTTISSS